MGIIINQSVRQSVVQYIGIAIGLLSTLFVYPLALAEMGLMRFIINTAQLATPFCLLGAQVLAVRFYPVFRDEASRHHGFLSLLHLIALGGVAVFVAAYALFSKEFTSLFHEQPAEYLPFLPYVAPVVLFQVMAYLYTSYATNFHKVVYPAIFNELGAKVGLPLLILAFYFQWIGLTALMNGMVALFGAVFLAHALYLAGIGQFSFWLPDWRFITKPLRKDLLKFGSVNIMSNWAFMLSNRIDIFMLGLLLGPDAFKGVGIYAIFFVMSEVIDTPRKALMNISSPIIADAWKREDRAHLKELYEKSSLNQFLAGWLLFLGIWAALEGLFVLMPNGEEVAAGRWVFFFLGLAKVAEMLTGVNALIIQHSRYFRFNFYSVLLLAVVNILNNLWLIPLYGMLGAAISTLISVALYNLAKFVFLLVKMGMNPFSKGTLIIFVTGLVALGLGYLVPVPTDNVWLAIAGLTGRSLVIAGVYIAVILYLRVSEDLNEVVRRVVGRLRG